MNRVLEFLFLCVIVVIASSCNIDEVITTSMPPRIILDSESGVYTVKQGREVIIAPSYESAENATYRWTMDGRLLGNEASLTFSREKLGEYYIILTVTTDAGTDSEELRVDVVELEVPTVSIAGKESIMMAVGGELSLNATIRETSLETSFYWSVNGERVAEDLTYTFSADEVGRYEITASASNEDGAHSDTITVDVVNPEDMPFEWEFEREAYYTVTGRKLLIKPSKPVEVEESVNYNWLVAESGQEGDAEQFVFVADAAGEYHITATATAERGGEDITISHDFVITVYEEGAFYRTASSSSKADWNKVFDYTPAPGQFINELKTGGFDGTQTTREAAIAYAEARMGEVDRDGNPYPNWVSLGGFGGYIVVGFETSYC